MEAEINATAYTTEYCLLTSIIDEHIQRSLVPKWNTHEVQTPTIYKKNNNQGVLGNIRRIDYELSNRHLGMKQA